LFFCNKCGVPLGDQGHRRAHALPRRKFALQTQTAENS
jgi:hypothetical protein